MSSRPEDKIITFDGNVYKTFCPQKDRNYCYLIRWKKDEAEIHLPEKITHKEKDTDKREEYGLYGINDYAFDECQRIITVKIPANVRIFRQHCFSGKQHESTIEKIIFPDNPDLEVIEKSAFENCKKLKYIKFSKDQDINMEENDLNKLKNLKRILANAFSGCESLKNIKLPSNSNSKFQLDIGAGCFSGSGIEKVTIPKEWKYLRSEMFENCSHLQNILFENPSKLEKIETDVFKNCSLSKISIPSSVQELDGFSESSIKEITFEEAEKSQLKTVMKNAFSKCQKLSKIEFPPSVEKLCKESFAESSIEEIKFPSKSKLKVVGDNAFQKCKKLKRITIPSTISSIGAYAFSESSIPSLDFI